MRGSKQTTSTSSCYRLEMEFIGYIGEFNLSYEQLVNSDEKVTDL